MPEEKFEAGAESAQIEEQNPLKFVPVINPDTITSFECKDVLKIIANYIGDDTEPNAFGRNIEASEPMICALKKYAPEQIVNSHRVRFASPEHMAQAVADYVGDLTNHRHDHPLWNKIIAALGADGSPTNHVHVPGIKFTRVKEGLDPETVTKAQCEKALKHVFYEVLAHCTTDLTDAGESNVSFCFKKADWGSDWDVHMQDIQPSESVRRGAGAVGQVLGFLKAHGADQVACGKIQATLPEMAELFNRVAVDLASKGEPDLLEKLNTVREASIHL